MARPHNLTTMEYFKSAFEKCPKTGCWNWVKSMYAHGYGRIPIKIDGAWKHRPAHRIGYQLLVGKIPKGLQANHKCDNRKCVNPDHIFIGTQKENMDDMKAKGRHMYGEGHVHSLLTENAVRYVRRNYVPRHKEYGFSSMGRRFGVDAETVRDAYTRKTWAWVK